MNNKNELFKIEEELNNYFKEKRNKDEIPSSTFNRINNAFVEIENKKIKRHIPQVVVCIFSIIILSTGIVFAKDIVNWVHSLFTNSTEAIDVAINNGYLQNIEMEYVYDSDIGIKVDNLIMDDTNLDISFIYKCNDDIINSIELHEYLIKDENENILYKYFEDDSRRDNVSIGMHLRKYNEPVALDNNEFKESLLFMSENFINCKKIFIKVESVRIKYKDKYEVVKGNWLLECEINKNILKRDTEEYEVYSVEKIKFNLVEVTETSLKIRLGFEEKIDRNIIQQKENIILKDKSKKEYYYNVLKFTNDNELYLEYDLSKYSEDINILELHIQKNDNENIIIILKK